MLNSFRPGLEHLGTVVSVMSAGGSVKPDVGEIGREFHGPVYVAI